MRLAREEADPNMSMHKRAMEAALERGVNFIHSSYEYGVRWLMHEVLRTHPKRAELHHVIKVPVPDWDDDRFDAEKFETRIDEALRDLCTDRIALVQWMWRVRPDDEAHRLPRLAAAVDDAKATFERLRDKGKVGHLGCFPYYPESAAAAFADPTMRVLIAYFNPLELEMLPLIERLRKDGRGFLAIRPLLQGVLTDRTRSERGPNHPLSRPQFDGYFADREKLERTFPDIGGRGLTRFAIRFPLLNPNCASVIVGLNREDQVAAICDATADVSPDPGEVQKIATAMLAATPG